MFRPSRSGSDPPLSHHGSRADPTFASYLLDWAIRTSTAIWGGGEEETWIWQIQSYSGGSDVDWAEPIRTNVSVLTRKFLLPILRGQ